MNRFDFYFRARYTIIRTRLIYIYILNIQLVCSFLLFKARPTARFDLLLKIPALESSLYYIKTEK